MKWSVPLLLAVVAAVAGYALWSRRAPAPTSGGAPASAPGASDRSDNRPRLARPALPPSGGAGPTPRLPGDPAATDEVTGVVPAAPDPSAPGEPTAFDAEVRDPAWAPAQEREMGRRLRFIRDELIGRGASVTVRGVECRRTMCRVAFAARGTSDLSELFDAVERDTGLYGWAQNVNLGAVTTGANGQLLTRVTATFDRDD